MVDNAITPNRMKWYFLMGGLFLLSLFVVTGKFSGSEDRTLPKNDSQENFTNDDRVMRERRLTESVEAWRTRLEKIRREIHSYPLLSTRRSHLKKIHRELRADWRLAKSQLRDLRLANGEPWEHLADHLEATLGEMEETYNKK